MNTRLISLLLTLGSLPVFSATAPAQAAPPASDDGVATTTGDATAPDPAERLYWDALKLFRSTKPAEWTKGRAMMQEAADLEFGPAQMHLGQCLLTGAYGFPKSPTKAAGQFRLGAERGDGFARVNYALCLMQGTGVSRDKRKAAEWFKAALEPSATFAQPVPPADFFEGSAEGAKAGDAAAGTLSGETVIDPADRARAQAHFCLAQILEGEKKGAEAQVHYEAAANFGPGGRAGSYEAAVKAAINLAFGQGVPRDLEKANALLEQSKKLGRQNGSAFAHSLVERKLFDDFAQADLEEALIEAGESAQVQLQQQIAGSFADPKSKTYNPREAARWYELAAEGGDAWAMLSLAQLYRDPKAGLNDPVKAFQWYKRAAEKSSHLLAWGNLGICYQRGLGTPADPTKAAEIFAKYADQDIVSHLGKIGQCPPTNVSYEDAVELNKLWAGQKNDPHAQYLLGVRYLYGWGVKADVNDATKWFTRAAKTNHGAALCRLGLIYEDNGELIGLKPAEAAAKALDCYRRGAAVGNVDATANLAHVIQRGAGVAADLDEAERLYRTALSLDPKHDRSLNNLGSIYQKRLRLALGIPEIPRFHISAVDGADGKKIYSVRKIDEPTDEAKAPGLRAQMLKCYGKAAQLGSPFAAYNLAELYYKGELVGRDYQAAYLHFEDAVARKARATDAHRILGQMHENGEGVPVTLREAAYHYRIAALDGDRESLRRLCSFYLQGKGVTRDLDRAAFWLERLAASGDRDALGQLADTLMQKGDYAQCLTIYRNMADSNNKALAAFANLRLSLLYKNGWGVKASPEKAQSYFKKALDAGNVEAAFRQAMEQARAGRVAEALGTFEKLNDDGYAPAARVLGGMYFDGAGVPRDRAKAFVLLTRAAEAGDTGAKMNLARCTLRRVEGAPPLEKAIAYASEAEAAGNENATKLRVELEAMRDARETTGSDGARRL